MPNLSLEDALLQWGPILEMKEKRIYGMTSAGQRYAITISNYWICYHIALYLEEDHMDLGGLSPFHTDNCLNEDGLNEKGNAHISWILMECATACMPAYNMQAAALQTCENQDPTVQIQWLINRLNRTPLLTYDRFEDIGENIHYYFNIIRLPDDCKLNPDQYLQRGDHVQITRKGGVYTHDAIYIGHKQVIHIFDEKDKSKAGIRKDHWSIFIGDPSSWWGTVSIVVYRLHVKSLDQVALDAERLFENDCGQCKSYHFIMQNCQHFASYCATEAEISIDVNRVHKLFMVKPVANISGRETSAFDYEP